MERHNNNPKVAISILNWNEKESLRNCLNSIYNKTGYSNYKVIVVDNGSEDGSAEMVKREFEDVYLIENDLNLGFSKGNNQAFDLALDISADFVVMMNNDVEIVESDWLTKMVDVGVKEEIRCVGCKVYEPDGSVHYDGRYFPISNILFPIIKNRYMYNIHQKKLKPVNYQYVDEVVGALMLVDCDAIKDIGGLDEAYSPAYSEESDYCARIWSSGYKIAFRPDTCVLHSRHVTSDKLDQTYLTYVKNRNKLRLILTNYPLTWILYAIFFSPLLILRQYISIADSTSRIPLSITESGKREPVRSLYYGLKSYYSVLTQIEDIIDKRQNRKNVRETTK